ncbi:MAG: YraN family protein [Bacteroidota bacterium]
MGAHNEFGRLGEKMAAKYLSNKGYRIRDINYRYQKAEIDIVAQKDNILAVVEVKSRSSDRLQEIAETVNQKKIGLLVSAADDYVTEKGLEVDVRFDIITILKRGREFEITHLEDAYYHF